MATKYSRKEFEDYKYRFIVQFDVWGDSHLLNLNIYSNSGDVDELENFIRKHKSEKVMAFKTIHRASKEQDDLDQILIDEVLAGID